MISMMPDALLARQLRVSGALASRPLKEDHDMLASTTVSQLLAGWARLYGHTPVSATVTYLHLVGILVGGGVAVAADRASLRLSPETLPDWRTELDRLAAVHRWVVGGLALIFASGLLMALAQVANFGTSVVFWTKMGLVALLIGNGYARLRTEIALRQGSLAAWSWFRRTSTASLVLWFLVLLAERCFTPPADVSVTIVASEHEPDPDVDRRALRTPGRGDRQRVGAAVLPGEPEPAPCGGVPAV